MRYRVLVMNAGRAEVTAPARLSVDDAVIDTANVALMPGEWRQDRLPRTHLQAGVTAAADPDGTIVESSESDNIHEVPCPRAARRDPSSGGKRLSRRYDEDGERPLSTTNGARLITCARPRGTPRSAARPSSRA